MDALFDEILEDLERRGLKRFPGLLTADGAVASWPDDLDLAGFLELAQSLGVDLVYTHAWMLTEEDLDELLRVVRTEREREDVAEVIREAEERRDETNAIQLAFMHRGVAHEWTGVAGWYQELEERVAELGESVEVVEAATWSLREAEWVGRLARDPAFQAARTRERRKAVALRLIPELDILRRSSSPWEAQTANRVVTDAWEVFQTEVLPDLERRHAERGRELLVSGLSKAEAAGRLGMGTEKLNRLLGQYPSEPA